MENEIIIIKQLPVIQERLQTIKADVSERVSEALSLVCTAETVKTVRAARADLTKEFKFWEEKRKQVKSAIMSPYEQFESIYKDCIVDVFKNADTELKNKIDSVENELKKQKEEEIERYFAEYVESKNIPIPLHISDCHLNITLSASIKSLKGQVKSFVDKICDDIELINTQENKDEILYEYKQSLNVSAAITTTSNRHKAIEETKEREKEAYEKKETESKSTKKTEHIIETLLPPEERTKEKTVTVKFKVTGTLSQLKALKEFLNNGGYDYE